MHGNRAFRWGFFCALLLVAAALPGHARAAHCPDDTLVELVVTCVHKCGEVSPPGVPLLSYCILENGRCPDVVARAPDVPPYVSWCDRDEPQPCEPPRTLLTLALCNLP